MKPINTSSYDLATLIERGCVYVDKTAAIHELITSADSQYFLSRPRRFGKSLLVSTLKAIFQNRRELFNGLAIDSLPYDWKEYPVIHLDMGSCAASNAALLEEVLLFAVCANAEKYGIAIEQSQPHLALHELITKLAVNGNIVILVDEYDKPLLGHLGKESAKEIQTVLKSFYSVIKTTERLQRFVLLTGVSKFSKASIFSDLNNLTDLTMSRSHATLLGYTQEEFEANFADYIDRLALREGGARDALLDKLRSWYNGYCFHHEAKTVYNPVSVMKCLAEEEFRNHWFETGTPSFLIDLLREKPIRFGNLEVPEIAFSTYELENLEPLPLLVQTGYLTILDCEMRGRRRIYRLGYPNFEIEESFSLWLAEGLFGLKREDAPNILQDLVRCFEEMDLDGLFARLQTFFAGVPNTIALQQEKYYQTIFFVIFKLLGVDLEVEVSTNLGRIDAMVATTDRIYVFEFKLNDTVQAAMAQIHDKKYYEKYQSSGKKIILIGAAFDKTTRNLDDWLVEELKAEG